MSRLRHVSYDHRVTSTTGACPCAPRRWWRLSNEHIVPHRLRGALRTAESSDSDCGTCIRYEGGLGLDYVYGLLNGNDAAVYWGVRARATGPCWFSSISATRSTFSGPVSLGMFQVFSSPIRKSFLGLHLHHIVPVLRHQQNSSLIFQVFVL